MFVSSSAVAGQVFDGQHESQSDIYALFDPARPEAQPRFLPYMAVIGGAWGPHGLFATVMPGSTRGWWIQIVDAAMAEVTREFSASDLDGL